MKTTILSFILLTSTLCSGLHAESSEYVSKADYNALLKRVEALETILQTIDASEIIETVGKQKVSQSNKSIKTRLIDNVVDAIHSREESANYPWMDEYKWSKIKTGMTISQVIGILGVPTLDEPSLSKRIDTVYTYQGRRVATGKMTKGKIRFYKNKVVNFEKPKL